MRRGTDNRNILEVFAEEFCKVVELHCRYIIVSGFVAISTGRTRATEDIDMILPRLDVKTFELLHRGLTVAGFEAMQSDSAQTLFNDYLKDGLSIRYVKIGMALPEMEIKFSKDALDDYQLKTRVKIPLTGLDLWFSSISMNIAFKEEFLKSDKDLEDARHLRKVFEAEVNEDEINKVKSLIQRYRLT